jgi:hypothetical protein
MRYCLKCNTCGSTWWVRGTPEYDINAVTLDEDDPDWSDSCLCGMDDYEIIDSEEESWDPY